MGFIWITLSLAASFLIACLVRRFGSHTMINGYMSKEQADNLFPGWTKAEKNNIRKNGGK